MGHNYMEIKSDKKIAILDCNNFYVSCERVFNPKIQNIPTVVLSNNDGCVIARSQEVKNMGVGKGNPYFQLDNSIKESIQKFSSNYSLYGDMSDRINNILKRFCTKIEIYSIDECFLDVSNIDEKELVPYLTLIKKEIQRLVGIPVSIGVAPNKTLSKIMNGFAKKRNELNGVCSYWDFKNIDDISISDVWGVGDKSSEKLNSLSVTTIGQFKKLQPFHVRKMMTVVGLRTWLELHEKLVYDIQTSFKKPKVVSSSRSFGKAVWQKEQVQDSIWTFLEDATKKLKSEELKGRTVVIYSTTNRFKDNFFCWSKRINLSNPSNHLQDIWDQIHEHMIDLPFKPWEKAGVIFIDLIPENITIHRIFEESVQRKNKPLVENQDWMTRREFLSPKWTTDWNDIPRIN